MYCFAGSCNKRNQNGILFHSDVEMCLLRAIASTQIVIIKEQFIYGINYDYDARMVLFV